MPNYKNNSSSVKTFYGVEFKPGEVHFVPGYIRAKGIDQVKVQTQKDLPKDEPKIIEPEAIKSDIVKEKPNALDVIAKEHPEVIESLTPPQRKKSRGKKPKKIIDEIKDSDSVDTILSENILEEGEES